MKNPGQCIRKLRGLSHTWRWNFHPRVRQESVAEHSFWVAIIVNELVTAKELDAIRADCLAYALYHDAEESVTGDLPNPVKRGRSWNEVEYDAFQEIASPTMHKLYTSNAHELVKKADVAASLLFADEELQLGNSMFEQIRGELIHVAFGFNDHEFTQLLLQLGFIPSEALHPIGEMSHL